MECFTDPRGHFVFPERLFPEPPGEATAPQSVEERRAAIEHEFGVLKAAGIERNYKWAVNVFQFQETWGDIQQAARGDEMLAQARRIIEKLASGSTQYAGAANYTLGRLARSDNESRVHYRTALKKGFQRAWYRVAVKAAERKERDSALSRFRRGAERGDAACLYTLGIANLKGLYKLRKNVSEGIMLIEQALHGTDADFPRAPYVLGKILLGEGGDVPNGLGLELGRISQNRERGIELVRQSAMLGYAPALFRMGQARQSKEFGFDCAAALRYMSLAAEQEAYKRFRGLPTELKGDPEANIIKWLLCGYKDIIRVNEPWAFRFAEVGASERNGTALFALGYFHEVGVNTDTDASKALDYYRQGAKEGCAAASARLEQMSTNKPNLRRTLTRQDHDAKLRKHRNALINGDGDAGLAAINDQSTLEAVYVNAPPGNKVPSPIPEPQPEAHTMARSRPPYPESPNRSPATSMSDLTAPQRGPSLSSLSSGPSMHSVGSNPSALPYPVEDDQEQGQLQQVPHFNQEGSFHSVSDRPPLPYPDDYDPKVPLTFGGHLPYPRSPESPKRSPSPSARVSAALESASLEDTSPRVSQAPPYRSISSGAGAFNQNNTSQQVAPRPQQSPGFRRGHGSTMSMCEPTTSRLVGADLPMRSSESLQTLSEQQSSVGPNPLRQGTPDVERPPTKPPNRVPVGSRNASGAVIASPQAAPAAYPEANNHAMPSKMSFYPPPPAPSPPSVTPAASAALSPATAARTPTIKSRGNVSRASAGYEGLHTAQDSTPVSARSSLHNSPSEIPNLSPHVPVSGSDPALHMASSNSQPSSRVESLASSPLTHFRAASNYSNSTGSPVSSGPPSPSQPWGTPENGRSPPGSPGSTGSPGRRRKARPLSSGWVRDSFLPGAGRFFSASQPDLDKAGYIDMSNPEPQVRQRSPSPLRKMFRSGPEHRSVTDSAALHTPKGPDPLVANMPKVPVQPIQEKREPGVAYTFEDMGITTVTNAKNDKCIIA